MFYVEVDTNLLNPDGEKVHFGPYYFRSYEDRTAWERRFKRGLAELNSDILGDLSEPYRITAMYASGGQYLEDEVMDAPSPEEAIRNLRYLCERRFATLPIS